MKPVVYIDTLFLINLIFNMLIYYMSAYFLKRETKALRIFLVAVLGAFYGVFMFFPKLGVFYTGIFKALFMVLSAKLLFSSKGLKALIKTSLVCFFVSIGFCGAISGAISLCGAAPALGMVISGGIVYLDLDPLILIFGVMVSVIILIFFSSSCKESSAKEDSIKEFTVSCANESFCVKALADTGCGLYDPTGIYPALIVERELIPEKILEETEKISLKYKSVTRENESIEGFIPDSITDREGKISYKAIVAIGRAPLDPGGRFNGVVNPAVFNLSNSEGIYEKTV